MCMFFMPTAWHVKDKDGVLSDKSWTQHALQEGKCFTKWNHVKGRWQQGDVKKTRNKISTRVWCILCGVIFDAAIVAYGGNGLKTRRRNQKTVSKNFANTTNDFLFTSALVLDRFICVPFLLHQRWHHKDCNTLEWKSCFSSFSHRPFVIFLLHGFTSWTIFPPFW